MVATKNDMHSELNHIKQDLRKLRDDLSSATGALYESGRESVRAAGDSARESAEEAATYVRSTINERPLTSLLIAAGVGLLVGTFFRRSQ